MASKYRRPWTLTQLQTPFYIISSVVHRSLVYSVTNLINLYFPVVFLHVSDEYSYANIMAKLWAFYTNLYVKRILCFLHGLGKDSDLITGGHVFIKLL